MNIARVVVLTIALSAGGAAAYLARGTDEKIALLPNRSAQLPTVEILVAKSDIGSARWSSRRICNGRCGRRRRTSGSHDQPAPAKPTPSPKRRQLDRRALPSSRVNRSASEAASKANGSGFMAAILPTGMRAISTEISPETGAGGFILPNDRVDVILSKREKNPDSRVPISSSRKSF